VTEAAVRGVIDTRQRGVIKHSLSAMASTEQFPAAMLQIFQNIRVCKIVEQQCAMPLPQQMVGGRWPNRDREFLPALSYLNVDLVSSNVTSRPEIAP